MQSLQETLDEVEAMSDTALVAEFRTLIRTKLVAELDVTQPQPMPTADDDSSRAFVVVCELASRVAARVLNVPA